MMDDETKKAMDLVQREMVRALSSHIGTKPDPEAVRSTVQKMLDSMRTDKKSRPRSSRRSSVTPSR